MHAPVQCGDEGESARRAVGCRNGETCEPRRDLQLGVGAVAWAGVECGAQRNCESARVKVHLVVCGIIILPVVRLRRVG